LFKSTGLWIFWFKHISNIYSSNIYTTVINYTQSTVVSIDQVEKLIRHT